MTIQDDIAAAINDGPRDQVWTAADFAEAGSRDAVDKALQRLANAGLLLRVGRGLYVLNRMNALTGAPFRPSPRAVVEALQRRDQLRMLVDGMTAANDLGFTTAVPARTIVHTDGRRQSIELDGLSIEFRLTAPSKLVWANRPAMRLVQALSWLHERDGAFTPKISRRVRKLLRDGEEGAEIRRDLQAGFSELPTDWMKDYLRPILAETSGEGRSQ